jgi:hypothetical protein
MKITYLGLVGNQFKYSIELEGHTFSYFTGIGHIKINPTKRESNLVRLNSPEVANLLPLLNKNDRNLVNRSIFTSVYRVHPKDEDVLECLQSDVEFGRMTFKEFCDSLGYNEDSIKDRKVYFTCQDMANKLGNFFDKRG